MTSTEERIVELSEQVASGFATSNQKLDAMTEKISRLETVIDGNGHDGIRIEVDRLKAAERRRTKREWVFAGALLSLAVTVVGFILKAFIGS